MASKPPSLFARAFGPFVASLWFLLLVWSVPVALVWTLGFGEAELAERIANPGLRDALAFCLRILDPAWITLAATCTYLALAEDESLCTVRRWALTVIIGVGIIGTLSVTTDLPLGPIRYTPRLGMMIGLIPIALPLLWFTIILGARALALHLAPRASHTRIAIATGILAALTDLSLEPLAWKARALWLWYPNVVPAPAWPPLQNFLTWLLAAAALAYTMRESKAAPPRALPRPAIIFLILHGVFIATHIARAIPG